MADSPREPGRIAAFAAVLGTFATSVGVAALLGRRTGKQLPDRVAPLDVALGGLATFKFARMLSKDAVTTPIRAPFTEFEENAGAGEVVETPKPGHPQHTIGDLLSCPFCLAPWVSTSYVATLAVAPRLARAWAATFSVVALSDTMQFGYDRLKEL
ncbi:MAG TPA: DUF1360 domain-containing protein [Marmoricola sp.]|nr:DUF1360 domain-containing protein [Marmoricola sp.]